MGVPYFTSEEIKEKRDELYGRFERPSHFIKNEKVFNYIKNNFSPDAGILDVGCASGALLRQLSQAGFNNTMGVDIDNYLYFPELASKLKIADLNKEKFPLDDESADIITALQTMEHLENPFHFIRECERVLKKGGHLILSVPNGHTIWDKIRFFVKGNLINYNLGNNHIIFLTRDVFAKTILKNFEIKETFYDHGWIPWVRPRRITARLKSVLPPWKFWSLNVGYILVKKHKE